MIDYDVTLDDNFTEQDDDASEDNVIGTVNNCVTLEDYVIINEDTTVI